MALQIHCPHCFQSLILPYTEAGLKVNCPNCHGPIVLTAAHEEIKKDRRRAAPADHWFLKAEDGKDYGPVDKKTLDAWYVDGRISADCQVLHVGDEQWHWAGDLFPQLEEGQGEVAQGKPLKRYDISDLLPPVVAAPAYPAGMYGLPGSPAPLPTMGLPAAPIESGSALPLMTRRLNESRDPTMMSSSLYLETLEKLGHQRGDYHPLVVATAVLNFLFGTYTTIVGFFGFVIALQKAADVDLLLVGDWRVWAPMLPLALAGYGIFVLQTGMGLLNYQAWAIMAVYIQSAISMTVSIIICVVLPPLFLFSVAGIVYGILASIAVSIPSVVADFD